MFKDKKHGWRHYSDLPRGYPLSILSASRDINDLSSSPIKVEEILMCLHRDAFRHHNSGTTGEYMIHEARAMTVGTLAYK